MVNVFDAIAWCPVPTTKLEGVHADASRGDPLADGSVGVRHHRLRGEDRPDAVLQAVGVDGLARSDALRRAGDGDPLHGAGRGGSRGGGEGRPGRPRGLRRRERRAATARAAAGPPRRQRAGWWCGGRRGGRWWSWSVPLGRSRPGVGRTGCGDTRVIPARPRSTRPLHQEAVKVVRRRSGHAHQVPGARGRHHARTVAGRDHLVVEGTAGLRHVRSSRCSDRWTAPPRCPPTGSCWARSACRSSP